MSHAPTMNPSKFKVFALSFFIVVLCLSTVVVAATTGKIRGKVIDKNTNDPVINANVKGVDQDWGDASDLRGEFVIMNVQPGLYNVEISCIGYHTITIKDVYVASDLTTDLNIELTASDIVLEEVEVVFERPEVEMDVSGSETRMSKADINAVRPENVTEVVKMTTGFKIDEEGKMHLRGSRAGDVAFIVEGIDLRDPLVDTQIGFNLATEGVDEVSVLTGGFAAEYGRVMGGVIQVTTSEGNEESYSGRVEYATDRIIEPYSFNTDQIQIAFGGPVPYTNKLFGKPLTFYFTGISNLTDTYVPFQVDREPNDYLGLGLNLPERQYNNYQSSLKLAYKLSRTKKLSLYMTSSYRQWDIYPNGEGGISGNYGYGYKYNVENRPWAYNQQISGNLTYTDQVSSSTFYEIKAVYYRTHSKVQPRDITPGDVTLRDDIENDIASAFDRNGNGTLDDDEYLDSDGNGFMDGFWDANRNRIFDGGGEGYEDLNMNGRWDRGEDWVDLNGNGIYDAAEPWIDVVNPLTGENNIGVFDSWDQYTDINENGRWDPAEPQLPEQDWNGNGKWDGERFIDADGNGAYDPWEPWDDLNGNFLWDPGEPFTDTNGDGQYTYSEGYDDMNNNGMVDTRDLAETSNAGGFNDSSEPFIDGDYYYDTGEPFIDEPDPITGEYNGRWDEGEVWFDLPSSSNPQTGAGLWHIGTEMTLNGKYDPPNGLFDEYELFCRPVDWSFTSDPSMPIEYRFDPLRRGSDWPTGVNADGVELIFTMLPQSTWINRTLHDNDPGQQVFNIHDNNVNEDEEWFDDYNGDGEWTGQDYFLNPGLYDPTLFYQDRVSTEYTLKFDIQSQVGRFHEMKSGFEVRYRNLEMQTIQQPDLLYDGEVALPDGSLWPDRGGVRDFYDYKPIEGAAYIQDKMEFEGLIVNAGIRGDFIIHDSEVVNLFRDMVDQDQPGAIYAERGTYRISPRLGISHPISEDSKLYFNYGHFYQAPSFQYFYRSATANFDANSVIGNPNLEYEKTIQYELGVNTLVGEDFVLDISGYYKDQFDMISTQDERWKNLTIDRYANIDYGRMRGFELSIEKKPSHHYAFTFNYDFSFAYGKASSQEEAQEARLNNVPYNYNEHPLSWDETHKINAYLTIQYAKDDHPIFWGMVMPDDWMLTMQWEFGSGRPYTPSTYLTGIDDPNLILSNSARRPWTERTTLKFEKYYSVSMDRRSKRASNKLIFGIKVNNLFNKQNVQSVYGQTGSPTRSIHPENPDYDTQGNRQEYDANPRNYGPGRQVVFRVGYSF